MNSILKLERVSKLYGNNLVVNNASFEIKKGSVCGLLGPNGEGKTTIMKIIMNEVKCDNGHVICEDNLKIKYLQDVPNFYEFYSVNEYVISPGSLIDGKIMGWNIVREQDIPVL